MQTVTDKESVRVQVRPWREALAITFGLLFVIYATVIVAGLTYTGWERMLPPQMNSVAVTALAVLFVTSLQLLLHHRSGSRSDEQFVVLSGQIADLKEALNPTATAKADRWEEPTVPNATATARVYASAAVVRHDVDLDAITDAVLARVEGRCEGWMSDLRQMVETARELSQAVSHREPEGGSVSRLLPHARR